MAGFIHKYNSKNPLSRLSSFNVNSKVFANSKTIGYSNYQENSYLSVVSDNGYDFYNNLASGSMCYGGISGYGMDSPDSVYNLPYSVEKRNFLRRMSAQDEIEEVLDIICDESIWFGDNTKFCELSSISSNVIKPDVLDYANKTFNDIYNYLGFSDGNKGWHTFRKLLIDGFLAYEIIFDNLENPSKIIGLKEIDPLSLEKKVNPETGEITYKQTNISPIGAIQYHEGEILKENQIIVVSYASLGAETAQRCSYVERLVRSFNLLRIAESTRIVWSVSNATFRTMFNVPVEKASSRGKQTLGQLMQQYHEDVSFNWDSGEMRTNGKAMLPFSKEYWFPNVDGKSIQMQTVGQDGPPINDTDLINYLRNKFRQTSKVPIIRFDKEQGMGAYALNSEGIRREEIKFKNFKNRLRQNFQEIILKPVRVQMQLKYNDLAKDQFFDSMFSVKFFDDSSFEEQSQADMLNNRSSVISSVMQNVSEKDEEGNDVPYFDFDFLVDYFSGLSKDMLETNKVYKERKKLIKDGYNEEDVERILAGEDKKKFKRKKPKKKEENSGEGENNSNGGGGGGEGEEQSNSLF